VTHCLTHRNKHIMHETSTAESQVRASVCFWLFFHFNCEEAWYGFCGDMFIQIFSYNSEK
jgi:hypothetical protein